MELRKCRPDQIRASVTSASASENRPNERVVPVTRLSMVNGTSSVPKKKASASVTEVEKQAWPDVYSGWFTVSRAVHDGSASVASFPSVSARWIAWIGRQK